MRVKKIATLGSVISIAAFSGCASSNSQYPFSAATRPPQSVRGVSATGSSESSPAASDYGRVSGNARDELASHIVGGRVVRTEEGAIVVLPSARHADLQQVGLTTDAIIASSVLSKLSTHPDLKAHGFEVTSNAGVLSIHARQDSIQDAISVINLALTVPDVRKIVYYLPSSA